MTNPQHIAFLILLPPGSGNSVSTQAGGDLTLTLATVDSLESAERLVSDMAGQGIDRVELSASFGDHGLAEIRAMVSNPGMVGLVRFE
ncbi:DUF6506 family protein [Marinobacter sp.]|uniref:DUF6506 family protein n=1 Tax=Marinobacter sp. TaxID=50741 RepID=UPI00356628E0